MRADIQEIFKKTPHQKQVMMFSATLSQDIRPVCKKFMTNVRADDARGQGGGGARGRRPGAEGWLSEGLGLAGHGWLVLLVACG